MSRTDRIRITGLAYGLAIVTIAAASADIHFGRISTALGMLIVIALVATRTVQVVRAMLSIDGKLLLVMWCLYFGPAVLLSVDSIFAQPWRSVVQTVCASIAGGIVALLMVGVKVLGDQDERGGPSYPL